MTEENQRLDQLFESARNQAPQASYEQTKKVFVGSLATGAAVGILAKWATFSIKLKMMIMVSTVGILSFVTVFSLNSGSTNQTEPLTTPNTGKEATPIETITENEDETHIEQVTIITSEDNEVKRIIESKTIVNEPEEEETVSAESTTEEKDDSTDILIPVTTEKTTLFGKADDLFILDESDDSTQLFPENKPKTQGSTSGEVLFKVSSTSTEADFKTIREAAEAAGIRFTYNLRIRKNKIKHCEFSINYTGEDGQRCWKSFKINGRFKDFRIGWYVDENGKATGLMD
jgi:hypothetical protein